MSYSVYGYVGAYVHVPKIRIVDTKQIKRCSNIACKNHTNYLQSSKFCAECGSEIESTHISKEVTRELSLYDLGRLDELWHDMLCNPTEHPQVFFSNQKWGTGISLQDSNTEIVNLDAQVFLTYKAKFEEKLTELGFFKLVQDNFNVTPEVRTGAFSYSL